MKTNSTLKIIALLAIPLAVAFTGLACGTTDEEAADDDTANDDAANDTVDDDAVDDGDGDVTDDDTGPTLISVSFENQTRETLPELTAASVDLPAGLKLQEEECSWGCIPYEIYVIFAEEDPDGGFGVNNLYFLLGGIDDTVGQLEVECDEPLAEEDQNITAPFFGTEGEYTCAENEEGTGDSGRPISSGTAWAISGEEGSQSVDILRAYSTQEEHHEVSSTVASFDETTNSLAVELANFNDYNVDYYTGSQEVDNFIMRTEYEGNVESHDFTLRLIKRNIIGDDSNHITMVGSGISQGEGNHFLFKVSAEGMANDATDVYLCYDAATKGISASGQTGEVDLDEAGCGDYVEAVDSLEYFVPDVDTPTEAFETALDL